MRRGPARPSPVMEALRALERDVRRKAKPDAESPASKKNPKPPRATGGKPKKAKG